MSEQDEPLKHWRGIIAVIVFWAALAVLVTWPLYFLGGMAVIGAAVVTLGIYRMFACPVEEESWSVVMSDCPTCTELRASLVDAEAQQIAHVCDHWFIQGGESQFGELKFDGRDPRNADELVSEILTVVRRHLAAAEAEQERVREEVADWKREAHDRALANLNLQSALAHAEAVLASGAAEIRSFLQEYPPPHRSECKSFHCITCGWMRESHRFTTHAHKFQAKPCTCGLADRLALLLVGREQQQKEQKEQKDLSRVDGESCKRGTGSTAS